MKNRRICPSRTRLCGFDLHASCVGAARDSVFVPADENHIPVCSVLKNIPRFEKHIQQGRRNFSFLRQIAISGFFAVAPGRKPELRLISIRRITRIIQQQSNGFGEGFVVKLHHKIHREPALTLTVPEPFVFANSQAVMLLPAVLTPAFYQFFSL